MDAVENTARKPVLVYTIGGNIMDNIKTVAFDFDGVIHSYTSGWQGSSVIPDPPVEGILDAIINLYNSGYEIVVVSTRCSYLDGRTAIRRWLAKYGFTPYVNRILTDKPSAIAYVDDRGINFDGDASLLVERIKRFVPWTKGGHSSEAYRGPLFDHPYVAAISGVMGDSVNGSLRDSAAKLYDTLESDDATDDAVINAIVNVICLSAVKLDSMGINQRDIMAAINRRLTQAVMPETQGTGSHDEDLPPDM